MTIIQTDKSVKNVLKKQIPLVVTLLIGVGLWYLPKPEALSREGWQIFAIFVATIVAIILKPLPMGAIAIISLAISTLTGTLKISEALAGYNQVPVWLVVIAFFISKGFIKTHLGLRIGYYFVMLFGKTSLGLAYSLTFSELLLSPAIPSVTARAGGIIYPIASGLSEAFNSKANHPSARNLGRYLILVCFQGSVITSAMFLTAMAANPLVVVLAGNLGVQISWGTWALGALVPGLLSIIVMPLVVYKLSMPTIKDIPDAFHLAKEKLKEMGKVKVQEWVMLIVFVLLIVLWIGGERRGIDSVTTAMLGVSILLIGRVVSWSDLLGETMAWDTLLWFGGLLALAGQLNSKGVIAYFSGHMAGLVGDMPWIYGLMILSILYFFSHYFFASSTAHVGAMFATFLSVAIVLGAPPMLSTLLFAYYSSLYGSLTHYGMGSAPVLFGAGYVSLKEWWKVGFVIAVFNIVIWTVVGGMWWRVLGWWE